MKTCTKCQIDKNHMDFYKNKQAKDGYLSWCKPCLKINRKPAKRSLLREKALEKLGAFCNSCGFSDKRALQIDHTNGGGNQEFRNIGNYAVYKKVADGDTDGYQVLCANCNWIKRAEKGENSNYFNECGIIETNEEYKNIPSDSPPRGLTLSEVI